MKRYIKANTDFKGWLSAAKKDLRRAASLDPDTTTYEDLKNIEWGSGRFPSVWINKSEKQGESVEDCIDRLLDEFYNIIADLKEEIKAKDVYDTQVYALKPNLSAYLEDNYDVIDQTEDSWIIEPPENATQKDCIAFVDDIKDFINGQYWGTSRGGSWTSWDLLSDGKVYLKAGWTRDNKWYVEVQ